MYRQLDNLHDVKVVLDIDKRITGTQRTYKTKLILPKTDHKLRQLHDFHSWKGPHSEEPSQ